MVNVSGMFSESSRGLKSSKIRELMKMASKPGIISLGGGMPDSPNLPFDDVKEIINSWNEERAIEALQYGATKGTNSLIDRIKKRMIERKAIDMNGQDIIITTGSQQALALVSKLFLDPGDIIIVEIPSFIGAIAAFYSFMGKLEGVEVDENGIIPELMEKKIESLIKSGKKVKLIYTIPNFNNPSGITLHKERRPEVLRIAKKFGIPILEDDPYGDFYFSGKDEDYYPIKSYDKDGLVIYLGTFSKVLSPGIRLGWIVAAEELIARLELQKQSFDACTPLLSQVIAEDYIERGYIDSFVEKMRSIYRERRDAAIAALEKYMPEGVMWTKPEGGFFVWVTLPEGIDPEDLFKRSVERNVAFVTGDAFLPREYPNRYIRLSYSNLSPEKIYTGIRIIAEILKEMLVKV